jgi:hypothetical protein
VGGLSNSPEYGRLIPHISYDCGTGYVMSLLCSNINRSHARSFSLVIMALHDYFEFRSVFNRLFTYELE